jgi:uncharacterized protein YndB with AHSA1/START domain
VHARSDNPLIAGAGAVVALPSPVEIEIMRTFEAPASKVFDAWTKPEQISIWWDPRSLPLGECDIDLRVGGSFRFVPSGAEGMGYPFAGRYLEITRPTRLVFATPAPSPGSETVGTLVFEEHGARTTLTITMLSATREDRDALLRARVDSGTVQTLENLDSYLKRSLTDDAINNTKHEEK